jgi:hypothetical protein
MRSASDGLLLNSAEVSVGLIGRIVLVLYRLPIGLSPSAFDLAVAGTDD